jgi:hypothetical protein
MEREPVNLEIVFDDGLSRELVWMISWGEILWGRPLFVHVTVSCNQALLEGEEIGP